MLIILGFTLLLILLVVLSFVTGILRSFLDWLLNLFRRKDRRQPTTVHNKPSAKKTKIISDSDGEYVEFEEIKK